MGTTIQFEFSLSLQEIKFIGWRVKYIFKIRLQSLACIKFFFSVDSFYIILTLFYSSLNYLIVDNIEYIHSIFILYAYKKKTFILCASVEEVNSLQLHVCVGQEISKTFTRILDDNQTCGSKLILSQLTTQKVRNHLWRWLIVSIPIYKSFF